MIEAEMHAKLGANHSRAHDRAEDLLTSTVFGILRYVPPAEGLLALLGRARPLSLGADGVARPLQAARIGGLDGAVDYEQSFWPRVLRHGEPDLLLTLVDGRERPVAYIIIEVKLGASKSAVAGAEDSETEIPDVPDPDQLIADWQALRVTGDAALPRTVVYLTAHPAPPHEELAASLGRCPQAKLAWLSWFDAEATVRRAAELDPDPDCPARDLSRLLVHKGFASFPGFQRAAPESPVVAGQSAGHEIRW